MFADAHIGTNVPPAKSSTHRHTISTRKHNAVETYSSANFASTTTATTGEIKNRFPDNEYNFSCTGENLLNQSNRAFLGQKSFSPFRYVGGKLRSTQGQQNSLRINATGSHVKKPISTSNAPRVVSFCRSCQAIFITSLLHQVVQLA